MAKLREGSEADLDGGTNDLAPTTPDQPPTPALVGRNPGERDTR